MRTKASKGPAKITEWVDADGSAGGNDAEQNGGTMGAFGTAGKQAIEPHLGHLLVLALAGRIVDRDLGMIDEAK